MRPHPAVTSRFVAALVFVVLFACGARAAPAAPPLIANDPAHPSPIEVTGGSTLITIADYRDASELVCAVLVNHAPRTATRMTLSFAMVDASGTVIGVDLVHPSGRFAPETPVQYSGGSPNGNCDLIYSGTNVERTSFWYRAPRSQPAQIAAVLVSAREVIFDDGTSFRTDNVPQSGDHVTLPPASPFSALPPALTAKSPVVAADRTPRIAIATPSDSPVEISEAYQQDFFLGRSDDPQRRTCVVVTNRDARTAKFVRLNLAIGDRNGTIAGVDTLDAKGTFSRGVALGRWCSTIAGWWTPDGFGYIPQGRRGPVVPIGTIVAVPVQVDFADGTSWQAPHPPQTGEPVKAP